MRLLVIASLLVALTACNKKKDQPEGTGAPPPAPAPAGSAQPAAPAPAPASDNYVDVVTQFKDRMCACADKPCVEKVQADLKAYGEAHPQAGLDVTPDVARRSLEIIQDMKDCAAKVTGGGSAAP